MTSKKLIVLILLNFLLNTVHSQNATITIKNKSDRHLTVKLMKGNDKKNSLLKQDSIKPKGTLVFDVFETGFYFTKTRAILYHKKDSTLHDTIYSKDRPMQLISDTKKGYSNLTIEYKVKESKENSSVSINRKEFDH